MRNSYLDYAMSVIVSRALPDARDGLKPVHRRILFAMHENNNYYDRPYKKSARTVGDVISKYHPHGDAAIYQSLVRMAQEFSLRNVLIDGQGNFGSMDGDAPAQMRYTEVRLSKIAARLLKDIDMDTVDFQPNYDNAETEPKVLPAGFPNLLVNGASGIAVGMATNIPTHNLGEVIDACFAFIDNPEIALEEILNFVPGPDFPTGGIIVGQQRARIALASGRGSVIIRSKTEIEELGGKPAIIVTEVPYQTNKAELVKKIEDLAKNKTIEGITELRDESNKLGVRVVIELRRDVVADVVLNQLFKNTQMQTSFSYNILALDHGRPKLMNLLDIIKLFVNFREEVVTRRTIYLLNNARASAHVSIGLSLAVSQIDEVIALIKSAKDPATAKAELLARKWPSASVEPLLRLVDDYRNEIVDGFCSFTEEQAKAILEMRLQRLTGLERNKIEEELQQLAKQIAEYLNILSNRDILFGIIKNELQEIKTNFATPRLTEILLNEDDTDIEDLIQQEDMVVTTTMGGYIKRVALASYRAQRRGGRGRSAMSTHDDDFTTDVIVTNTHATMLFFSNHGKVYQSKVYKLPLGSPQSKGRAMINIFPLHNDEKISFIMQMPENKDEWADMSIMFVTAKGNLRRNDLAAFTNIQSNGKIAIRLDEDDKLVGVCPCHSNDHVMLATRGGRAMRCPVDAVRIFKSRTSDGVRGIKLANATDQVISMSILKGVEVEINRREEYLKISEAARMEAAVAIDDTTAASCFSQINFINLTIQEAVDLARNEEFILAITEKGYGKRTSAYEYRITNRGGQGVANIDTSERNGAVVATFPVGNQDQLMLITNGGILIRMSVGSIRITGRNAMGVRLIDTKNKETVISASKIAESENDIEEEVEQGGTE
jgi:DNA gyrase subunit A